MSEAQTQTQVARKLEKKAGEEFVKHLLSLGGYRWDASSKSWTHKEGQEDRGALADLRSGLGKEPGEMARVHKHVVPKLPEATWNDRWYYITATLFGLFPKHRQPQIHQRPDEKGWKEVWTLGRAFRPLAFPPKEPKKVSMEARFVALLNAHPDDLDDHLRHAVSLLKSNEQPLDWFQLLEDLLKWDHPEGHVQLKWARHFYKSDSSPGRSATPYKSETPEQEKENGHE